MAYILNKSQQVRVRAITPQPAYSRVISLQAHCADGIDSRVRRWTTQVGIITWLLRMDIWLMNRTQDGMMDCYFYLMTGIGEPNTPENMIDQWEVIIPVYHADIPGMWFGGPRQHFWWTMDVLYKGDLRRFGLVLHNLSATVPIEAIASFQISEG